MSIDSIVATLKRIKSAVVISHYNPDADAYGASCGLGLALKEMGKKVVLLNESRTVDRYRFIPGVNNVVTAIPDDLESFDALIACDCGDQKRLGDTFKDRLLSHKLVINIDHHVSNTNFGTLNLVEPSASSTCEIVYKLIKSYSHKLSKEVATCLLTGIYGDTGSFMYRSTTKDTLTIASELVGAGAEPSFIGDNLSMKSLASVRIFSNTLANLKFYSEDRIAEGVIQQADFDATKSTYDDTEGLVEEIRQIQGVEIAVLLYWDALSSVWKVSMRARSPEIDLSKVAQEFGGGGHKAAAAFRWRRELKELQNSLIPRLQKELVP